MHIQQFYLGCLAHASYLIADRKTGTAAVVDPQRDIEQYLALAEDLEVEIKHVLMTHFHADFVAGHLELAKQGASIYIGARGKAEYDAVQLADGDVIEFGDVRIVSMETPGHTPEGVCFVAYDLGKDAGHPKAVFTGDTLFVGDVGRPDLLASVGVTAHELGEMLYDSLHERLLKLPDDCIVYPAHGAGSLCGKNLGEETFSTIGEQRQHNYALQPMSKEEFIKIVTADQPAAPQYFLHDAVMNKSERPTIDAAIAQGTQPLGVAVFRQLLRSDVQVVDTREEHHYAEGTVKGAWNLPLSGSFATWSGALLDLQKPILLINDPGKDVEAVTRLARVGLDTAIGYLDGGFPAIEHEIDLVQTNERISAAELRARQERGEKLTILDVRTCREAAAEPIPGTVHIPLMELAKRLDEVPSVEPLYAMCRSGKRSATAISMLARAGRSGLVNVAGGSLEWYSAPQAASH